MLCVCDRVLCGGGGGGGGGGGVWYLHRRSNRDLLSPSKSDSRTHCKPPQQQDLTACSMEGSDKSGSKGRC